MDKQKLLIFYKYFRFFYKIYLYLRGEIISICNIFKKPSDKPVIIYHACVQKTGSMWLKNIFNDKRIKKITNMKVFPQYRYEWGEFHKKFPKYTFIPGLYISYDLYEEIKKPSKFKTIYVVRDPRNIVVSWYYSMKYSHLLMGKVPKYRQDLNSLNLNEGLLYAIKHLTLKFCQIRTWINNLNDDPNIIFVKFEDLTSEPVKTFTRIFNQCGIDIEREELTKILKDYTKDKMREKDILNKKSKKISHYRKENTSYKDVFKKIHYDYFYNITGDLIDKLGYERD